MITRKSGFTSLLVSLSVLFSAKAFPLIFALQVSTLFVPASVFAQSGTFAKLTGSVSQSSRPWWSKANFTYQCTSGRNSGQTGIVDRLESGAWQVNGEGPRRSSPIEAADAACS